MKFKVTISRDSSNKVRIRLRDDLSRQIFAEATMDLESYAMAITGMAEQEAEGKIEGLEFVGKKLVVEHRTAVCPFNKYHSREDLREWLIKNCQEVGYILDPSLNSQGSVTYNQEDGSCTLRYLVRKYVEVGDA